MNEYLKQWINELIEGNDGGLVNWTIIGVHIGPAFRFIRDEKNLTHGDVVNLLKTKHKAKKFSQSWMSRIESSRQELSTTAFGILCDVYGVTPNYVIRIASRLKRNQRLPKHVIFNRIAKALGRSSFRRTEENSRR